jgi:hypothetical protein
MMHALARGMTIAVLLATAGLYAGRVYSRAAPDAAAPFVKISSPGTDEIVSGLVTVTAATADNVGTVGVQFLINGSPLGAEDTTAPFSVSWDTWASGGGAHILSAIARDAAGNAGDSELQPVIVGAGDPHRRKPPRKKS